MTHTISPIRSDAPSFRTYSFGEHVWRYKVVIETTLAISVLEPWEKVVFLIVLSLLALLLATGCVRFLPLQFVGMRYRLAYYLWGNEGNMHTT
ncbi:hypothetical protein AZE42_06284 [Rhizopogon vesiculosus]|uniref:Uncharacterized protein n=1 Tax=Rhizopogon vesiculosus TaxID=180088 RepID=A0A1J8QB45_9AGAM|nr:hypothetical protein AZE42_06284 [Rhizopogon vesiculosus]